MSRVQASSSRKRKTENKGCEPGKILEYLRKRKTSRASRGHCMKKREVRDMEVKDEFREQPLSG